MTSIASLGRHLAQVTLGGEVRAYELDQQQQVQLLFLLFVRENVLAKTLDPITFPYVGKVAPCLGLVGMGLFTARHLTHRLPSSLHPPVLQSIDFAFKGWSCLLNHSDALWNLAYLITGFVLIWLGHPAAGGLYLLSLGLTFLRLYGQIPRMVDKLLIPTLETISLYTLTLEPNPYLRALFVGLQLTHSAESLAQTVLPWSEEKTFLSFSPPPLPDFPLEACKTLRNLHICLKSVHALAIGACLPPPLSEDEEKQDVANILIEIEKRLATLSHDQEGWQRLKQVLTEKTLPESLPPNLSAFCELLKRILFSILQEVDTVVQQEKLREITKIGSSCSEGWTRDLHFFFNSSSHDLGWCVHTHLAKERDNLLSGSLLHIKQSLPLLFVGSGGENNVHLLDQISSILWHKWRTYRGELCVALYGRSTMVRYLQNLSPSSSLLESCRMGLLTGLLAEPSLLLAIQAIPMADRLLSHYYTPLFLQETLYEAIHPTYREEQGHRVSMHREIEWSPVALWLSMLPEKGISILDEGEEYLPSLVAYTPANHPYLTRQGVRLLLLDLGILYYEI